MAKIKFDFQRFFSHLKRNFQERLNDKEHRKNMLLMTRDTIFIVLAAKVVAEYGISATLCVGPSMIPTFDTNGDFVLVDQFSKHFSKYFSKEPYEVGDVILASSPSDKKKTVCKRIRAMEGDVVLYFKRHEPFPSVMRVPKDCVWLAGDNPSNSTDSRTYGAVPIDTLRGRVMLKFSKTFPPFTKITRTLPDEADTEDEEREDMFSQQAKKLLEDRRKREGTLKTQQVSPYYAALNRRAIMVAWHNRQLTDDEAEQLMELIQNKAADAYYIHHCKKVTKMIEADAKPARTASPDTAVLAVHAQQVSTIQPTHQATGAVESPLSIEEKSTSSTVHHDNKSIEAVEVIVRDEDAAAVVKQP